MASATYPDNNTAPPPYSVSYEKNTGVSYQQPVPPSIYPSTFVPSSSPPPSIPGYTQTTVIQPVIILPFLGRNPVSIQCPRCNQQVITVVQYESGTGTWLISLLICFFGGIFGCCLIPFCVPGCQDAVHSCPSCRAPLGRRNVF